MHVKTLAYAAVASLLLSAGAAPAMAQQVSLTSDSLFLLQAGSIGLLQASADSDEALEALRTDAEAAGVELERDHRSI